MSLTQIVIVEDDASVAELLRRVVQRFIPGAQAATFRTAEAAFPIVQRTPIALLIVDYHLPGMSGVELIQHLRRERADYPILLLSGDDDLPPVRQTGATSVLSKPFELARVRTLLEQMLAGGWEQARAVGDSTALPR